MNVSGGHESDAQCFSRVTYNHDSCAKVLIFEMVEARTPFVLPGSEQDIAKLFTNIACVKKRGVDFPDGFDDKAGGGSPHCRDLIYGMLAFEPGDRLGNHANG